MSGSNKMISDFKAKPKTQSYFTAIDEFVQSLGDVNVASKAQVSYSVNRKFLWLWAYEKTADGTLFLNVTLDEQIDDPHIHAITQTSKNRWNHSIVVKTKAAATSGWLHQLLRKGHEFAQK